MFTSNAELVEVVRNLGPAFESYADVLKDRGTLDRSYLDALDAGRDCDLLFAMVPKTHQAALERLFFGTNGNFLWDSEPDSVDLLESESGDPPTAPVVPLPAPDGSAPHVAEAARQNSPADLSESHGEPRSDDGHSQIHTTNRDARMSGLFINDEGDLSDGTTGALWDC
jgi:hypothetical protein